VVLDSLFSVSFIQMLVICLLGKFIFLYNMGSNLCIFEFLVADI
jgi:hypothetical protein